MLVPSGVEDKSYQRRYARCRASSLPDALSLELTIGRLAEVYALDEEIAGRRARFREAYARFASQNACGLHYVALPTMSIDLGRAVGRPELYARPAQVSISLEGREIEQAR
jgi:hypothetical protein